MPTQHDVNTYYNGKKKHKISGYLVQSSSRGRGQKKIIRKYQNNISKFKLMFPKSEKAKFGFDMSIKIKY